MRQLRAEDEHDLGCIAAAAQEVGSMQSVPAWQPQLCSISLLPLERLASLGQVAWINSRPCLVRLYFCLNLKSLAQGSIMRSVSL